MDDLETKIEQIAAGHAEVAKIHFYDMVESMAKRCESPIERLLLAAMYHVQELHYREFDIQWFLRDTPSGRPFPPFGGALYCQSPQGVYRLDFYIEMVDQETGKPWYRLAIECDGHDFHEKTKQQAQRDKSRDRWLQTEGISVLRFTGSEIWRDPIACADQVYDAILAASARHR